MFSLIPKKAQLPAIYAPFNPSIPNTFWGGLEMDRLFDQLFHGVDQTLSSSGWKAPMAVWEDQERYYVEVELAGITQDSVDVTVQDQQLVITYERKVPEGRQYTYNERPYGRFERRLALPESINFDSIHAEMRDGMLQLTLAKMPNAQPRKIAIQTR